MSGLEGKGVGERAGNGGRSGQMLARSLIAAVLLAGAFAVGGPLLSFRSDLAQLREIFHARVRREALLSAQVLSRHLRLLEGELFRLANRPEIDPTDSKLEPEQDLLDLAHRHSVLFGQGVAVLDAGGERVWSEPESLFLDEPLAGSEWFSALRAGSPRVVDAVHPGSRLFLVGVPVLRHGRFVGVVVGVFDPEEVIPPMEHTPLYLDSGAPLEMVVVDESGDLLSESRPPDWALVPDLGERVGQIGIQGASVGLPKQPRFGVAVPVGNTGLTLVLAGDESSVSEPLRQRFLLQLMLVSLVQMGAVGLLAIFLRLTFRRFHEYEQRAVAQARLLAMGSAATLIAHEVKNSLNGMKAGVSLLEAGQKHSEGRKMTPSDLPLRALRGQIDRLSHLASSLLLFGHPGQARRIGFGVAELVRSVVEGLSLLPEAAEVSVELQLEEGLIVEGDPVLVSTAVDNLIRNAIEAVVAAKDLGAVESPWVKVSARREGDAAWLVVEDNGQGPPKDVQARLFHPFVTGKAKGIGLGLAISQRVLALQEATIAFEATRDGSRFSIVLASLVAESAGAKAEEGGKALSKVG